MKRHRKRVGLVLGGGGARGWAHIGVIRALEERGIPVDMVAGTSIGSLVGAALAAGKTDALEETVRALDWKRVLYYFLEVSLPKGGLVDGKRILQFIRRNVVSSTIEDLLLPYRAVATDILSGQELVIDSGDVIDAVRASIGVPGMFTPVRRDGCVLVDGGLVNPVPVSVARSMGAGLVIAVDINHGCLGGEPAPRDAPARRCKPARSEPAQGRLVQVLEEAVQRVDAGALARMRRWLSQRDVPHTYEILGNSIRIMEAQITEGLLAQSPPDVLIRPDLRDFAFMDFHRAAESIEEGYRSACAVLSRTAKALPRLC